MNKVINESLKKSAKDLNYKFVSMDSGAGHDTAHLAKVSKASIIFIPCKNGLSHCPEEFAKIETPGHEQMKKNRENLE